MSSAVFQPKIHAAEIEQRLPNSSSNAALHYQRALLFLAEVDPGKRKQLEKPIWEIVTPKTSEQETKAIDDLLIAARHAIRAGLIGAAQANADFGANMSEYSVGTVLPHVGPMQDLAKLIALYGMQKEAEGDWQESAQVYLDLIRMGQHMGQQTTLAESIEGVRILETGYHALASWAVHSPDTQLIKEVRSLLGAIAPNPLTPATAIGYEAALVDLRLNRLQDAFPDGNWAEMMLSVIEGRPEKQDPASIEAFVKSEAAKRGVPTSVFDSKSSFDEFIEKLRSVNAQYYEATLNSLALPTEKSITVGEQTYQKFAPQLLRLGDPGTLNPGQIAAYFASHQAEHQLADLVLALSANKQGDLFPKDLSKVANDFGGKLSPSPTESGKLTYKVSPDQKGFRISYLGTKIGGVEIPEISFEYGGGGASK
ncbi:hypothetical protein [Bythopirellula polymerisocia]|uniref:hypothetical protein n=1 Tax=Bythopirellula polymerisocia TaxID=2528003 RepID=UPI0011B420E9|nr:hypothetical protein [Bythopirellula polymerisocia]